MNRKRERERLQFAEATQYTRVSVSVGHCGITPASLPAVTLLALGLPQHGPLKTATGNINSSHTYSICSIKNPLPLYQPGAGM